MSKPPSTKNKEASSPMKLPSPGKLVKKVKRRLSRLSLFGHVTPPKHASRAPVDCSIVASTPSAPIFPFIDVVRDFVPPPLTAPASPRSGYSKDTFADSDHHIKQVDLASSLGRSSSEASSLRPSSVSSATSGYMSGQSMHVSDETTQASAPEESSESPTSEPVSIPSVYVEPEVPDPFLADEEGDAASDEEEDDAPAETISESQQNITPSHESISTSSHPDTTLPISAPISSLDKPLPPESEGEEEEEEAPELYLPGLVIPTMFLPIPNTDPLTTLLTKYIYPPEKRPVRDLTGDWQRSEFHTLVMTNSWRALARMARDRLVSTDPEDLTLILGLWYLRLSSLARLRLFNQTSAECTNLFVVLNAIEPPTTREWVFERVLPFELEVMHARLKYWAGDHMGYLDALSALLKKCRTHARLARADGVTVAMWKERGARICLIIASQLVEMKDFAAATKLLEPLCMQGRGIPSHALRSSIARIYLQSGNLPMAEKHFAAVAADSAAEQSLKDMNTGLLASALGDWPRATEVLQGVLERDANNYAAANNLSVALLGQGKLKEGIDVLETALKSSPSAVVVAEPFLFNLSTLYELRSATALEKKRDLLVEVAKWSGDGLRTTCLKLPSS